jgi:hypothetical protein
MKTFSQPTASIHIAKPHNPMLKPKLCKKYVFPHAEEQNEKKARKHNNMYNA